jgi:hypothetical protein
MKTFQFTQTVQKLSERRGSYYFLKIPAEVVDQLEKGKATRLLCTVEDTVSYSCGLNQYGDGNYFIILASRYVKKLNKDIGDPISFEIQQHPNPLGVDVPEVLEVFLAQDPEAKAIYDSFTDGKKRTLIFAISRVKNIDLQIQRITDFLLQEKVKMLKKKRSDFS